MLPPTSSISRKRHKSKPQKGTKNEEFSKDFSSSGLVPFCGFGLCLLWLHVGDNVRHHGHRRDAELQILWVDFIERVRLCVVDVEVA